MLNHALKYLELGYSVIPCKQDKQAIIKWVDFQHTRPTPDQVKSWFEKYKYANIAIITGEVSGVDVIDCDTEDAFQQFNENFLSETVITPITKTPKGYHIYFKHRPGLSNAVRALDGTDLRTNGGYVIAPPSKNSNGNKYTWYNNLSIENTEIADMPDFVFNILEQASQGSVRVNACMYSCNNYAKDLSFLQDGHRDDDLFHIANTLVKGGCEQDKIEQVLNILAHNCNPPFDIKEVPLKIKSALARKERSEKNLSAEIRDWVLSNDVYFSSKNVENCLIMSNRNEKKLLSRVLSVMVKDGIIERDPKRFGYFMRKPDEIQPEDFTVFDENPTSLWLPFNLHHMVEIMEGNIIGIYGEVESGKTAFLLNIARYNLNSMRVHYFNSESGKKEFAKRLRKFDDITLKDWHAFMKMYPVEGDFHTQIKPGPGNLNIIDFLEIHKDFFLVGEMIKKIHDALKGAIAVVAIQKNPGRDDPLGGQRAMEKPRLVVALSPGVAKITKAKNWAEGVTENPRYKSTRFKLIDGAKLFQVGDWARVSNESKIV